MNDILTKWLAEVLDKFKAKNPKVFVYVQLLLVCLQFILTEVDKVDIIPNDGWIVSVLKVIGFLLMILVGSRTTQFVKVKEQVG